MGLLHTRPLGCDHPDLPPSGWAVCSGARQGGGGDTALLPTPCSQGTPSGPARMPLCGHSPPAPGRLPVSSAPHPSSPGPSTSPRLASPRGEAEGQGCSNAGVRGGLGGAAGRWVWLAGGMSGTPRLHPPCLRVSPTLSSPTACLHSSGPRDTLHALGTLHPRAPWSLWLPQAAAGWGSGGASAFSFICQFLMTLAIFLKIN